MKKPKHNLVSERKSELALLSENGASRKIELETLNSRLRLLASVPGMLIGTEPLEVQVRALAEHVRVAFRVDACVVRVIEGNDLVLLASSGVIEENLNARFPSSWGVSKTILDTKKPLYVSNVNTNETTKRFVKTLPKPLHIVSYAGAPLLVDNQPIGLIGVYTLEEMTDFSETDLEHLQIVANPIAIAITNDRLYKEVQTQKEALQHEMVERKKLESQYLQSQKMESIGKLAGGVAHDFNNLLMTIMGFSELAELELPVESKVHTYLQNIDIAASRAADLTQQLLAFARKQTIIPRTVSLNSLIGETKRMLAPLLGEHIHLNLIYDNHDTVLLDPGQMQQVLLNLIINARDAMPSGGSLSIRTRYSLSQDCEDEKANSDSGPYVCVEISDTGIGMSPEIQKRIFEPFFSTKELGKGTGLGLATVYGIVKQNSGHVCVRSDPGKGTTFLVYLPYHYDKSEAKVQNFVNDEMPRGSESILLVEDDSQLRDMMTLWLKQQGYRVTPTREGNEALQIALERSGDYALVITDSIMPEMGGQELQRRLAILYPRLPVLMLSGYSEEPQLEKGLPTDYSFLQKPFTSGTLARKTREMIDSS